MPGQSFRQMRDLLTWLYISYGNRKNFCQIVGHGFAFGHAAGLRSMREMSPSTAESRICDMENWASVFQMSYRLDLWQRV